MNVQGHTRSLKTLNNHTFISGIFGQAFKSNRHFESE